MKFKQVIHHMGAHTRRVTRTLGALALLGAVNVYAAMPAVTPPSTAPSTATNWLEFFKFYAKDALVIIGLLIMVYGLVQVVGKIMEMYGDLQSGRVTWGNIGGSAVGGTAILMFGLVLLTAAAAIL